METIVALLQMISHSLTKCANLLTTGICGAGWGNHSSYVTDRALDGTSWVNKTLTKLLSRQSTIRIRPIPSCNTGSTEVAASLERVADMTVCRRDLVALGR